MTKRCIQFGLATLAPLLGWGAAFARVQSRDSLRWRYDTLTVYGYSDKYIITGKQLPFRKLNTEFGPDVPSDLYRQDWQGRTVSRLLGVRAMATLVGSAMLRSNQQIGGILVLVAGGGLNLGSLRFGKKPAELVAWSAQQRRTVWRALTRIFRLWVHDSFLQISREGYLARYQANFLPCYSAVHFAP